MKGDGYKWERAFLLLACVVARRLGNTDRLRYEQRRMVRLRQWWQSQPCEV